MREATGGDPFGASRAPGTTVGDTRPQVPWLPPSGALLLVVVSCFAELEAQLAGAPSADQAGTGRPSDGPPVLTEQPLEALLASVRSTVSSHWTLSERLRSIRTLDTAERQAV